MRSQERKTPRWPSHMARNRKKRKQRPVQMPSECYNTAAVHRAMTRACEKAGVPPITPHRLRHMAAVSIRNQFGLEHARATLGHTVASMTEHYSKMAGAKLASEVAAAVG